MPVTPVLFASAIENFQLHQVSHGYSKDTVRNRVSAMRQFAGVCPDGLTVNLLTVDHVAALFARYAAPAQAGSYNNMLQALNAFVPWAVTKHYMSQARGAELLADRKSRKYKRQDPYILPRERFGEAIGAGWAKHPRDGIVISTGLYTLGRESELVRIQLKHIHLAEREMRVWREKQDDWRTWPVCPPYMADLNRYLAWLAAETGCVSVSAMMEDHADWYLCCALKSRGPRLAPEVQPGSGLSRVTKIIKDMLDALGIVVPAGHGKAVRNIGTGEHTLRRSGGQAELATARENIARQHAAGLVPSETVETVLRRIQSRFGHANLDMTLHYLDVDLENQRAVDHYKDHDPYGSIVPVPPAVPVAGNLVRVDFSAPREQGTRKARKALS